MTHRSRLLIAIALATAVPLVLFGAGVKRQLEHRLEAQYAQQVKAQVRVASQDLQREGASIAQRLSTIAHSLADDDRFRLAAVRGVTDERAYLLDYAGNAMRLAGLTMLQLQDESGRILSSGHFRNEFDRLEPELPRLLSATPRGVALVRARAPDGPFLALARADSARVGGHAYTLVGGVAVDSQFLGRFAREQGFIVTLVTPEDSSALSPPHATTADLPLEFVNASGPGEARLLAARIVISLPRTELEALLAGVNRWFLVAISIAMAASVALAAWLSTRLSEPLAALAAATARIELDGPDVSVSVEREDEVGVLARRLLAMATRLRASAGKLREAEHRATVGEMARQVNHDIKNGLIPIRNVLRHLVEVQEQHPAELPSVFAERRPTLESSISYLDTLARHYARLTPSAEHAPMDVNAIAVEVARTAGSGAGGIVQTQLDPAIPRVMGDPIVLRRILDNLVRNALESLDSGHGSVALRTSRANSHTVRIAVADKGRGMTEDEIGRAFGDFYTTKHGGTGLGLSVVRRLTADLQGTLRVESEPGRGSTFTIELPAVSTSG